jgi:hypothetical protein
MKGNIMIYAITYSDERYKRSAGFNLFTAKFFGKADRVFQYGPNDIDELFYTKYKTILNNSRGAGLWMWKPYIIIKTLEKIEYGDYLMYMDAGAYYIRSLKHLKEQLEHDEKDILLSSILLPNAHWCKRDAFIIMDCDTKEAREMHQVEATYIFLKKTDHSMKFIKNWLEWMTNEHLVDDSDNILGEPNYPGFRENRHDQTVLSLLAYKEDVEPYRGISDSSELNRFLWYGNGTFFGYTFNDFYLFARDEANSSVYQKAKYPRIVVNSRLRKQTLYAVCKGVVKTFIRAVQVDRQIKKDLKLTRKEA